MKKLLLLLISIAVVSCDNDDNTTLTDTSIDYSLVEANGTKLTLSLQSLDVENNDFTINSYVPNTSCCEGGNFVTENTVNALINGNDLSSSIRVNNAFEITLENFSEGMNYYNIEIDSGTYKKYFSFQFNFEDNQIDYLMVVSNNNNVTNYADAIFKFDIHTANSIRIFTETESGFNVFRENIAPNSDQLEYITSVRATTILKTSIEKL